MENLKEKVIGVLMGGISAEREVSLKSGNAVADALSGLGYNVKALDLTLDSIRTLGEEKIDVAFIALHGRFGEDGTVQGWLELLRIPYTGSSHVASAIAMNKYFAKQLMTFNEIPVTPFIAFSIDEYIKKGCDDLIDELPVVVKPMNEGSSVGVSLVKDKADLKHALELAFAYDDTILIEKYIKSRELQVGILNDEPLGVIEIIPRNEFYDFDAKYSEDGAQHIFPAKLDEGTYNRAMDLGLRAHKALGCSGATRVDFLYDENDKFYLLEVNTHPGMTEVSLLPEIADGVGIKFPELCERILNSARLNVKTTQHHGT